MGQTGNWAMKFICRQNLLILKLGHEIYLPTELAGSEIGPDWQLGQAYDEQQNLLILRGPDSKVLSEAIPNPINGTYV